MCSRDIHFDTRRHVNPAGPINNAGLGFLNHFGRRISQVSNDNRESASLFQRLSVLIQRVSAVAIQGDSLRMSSSRSSTFLSGSVLPRPRVLKTTKKQQEQRQNNNNDNSININIKITNEYLCNEKQQRRQLSNTKKIYCIQ